MRVKDYLQSANLFFEIGIKKPPGGGIRRYEIIMLFLEIGDIR